VRLIAFEPGFATTGVVALEPQLPLSPFGWATVSPDGSVSVKPIPVSVPLAFASAIVNASVVVAPTPIVLWLNALVSAGGVAAEAVAASADRRKASAAAPVASRIARRAVISLNSVSAPDLRGQPA
jgi:hypothetical protein